MNRFVKGRLINHTGRVGSVAVIGLSLLAVATKLCVYYAASPGPLSDTICQWDCNWYISLAKNGYDATPHVVGAAIQADWAFFPVYPLALVLVKHFTGLMAQTHQGHRATPGSSWPDRSSCARFERSGGWLDTLDETPELDVVTLGIAKNYDTVVEARVNGPPKLDRT